jgi:hypothetical protein
MNECYNTYEVLWNSPFRSVQEKLEDVSEGVDDWWDYIYYDYIDPGYALLGVFNKELSVLAWDIYYTELDINFGIDHKTSKIYIEAEILKHNYLVDHYNKISLWWLPKKEYYNHGI